MLKNHLSLFNLLLTFTNDNKAYIMEIKAIKVLEHLNNESKRIKENNTEFKNRFLNDFRYHSSIDGYLAPSHSPEHVKKGQFRSVKVQAFVGLKLSMSPILTKNNTVLCPNGQYVRLSKLHGQFSDDIDEPTITNELDHNGKTILLLPSKWLKSCKQETFCGTIRFDWIMSFLKQGEEGRKKLCDEYNNTEFFLDNVDAYMESSQLSGYIERRINNLKQSILSNFENEFFVDEFTEKGLEYKTLTLEKMKEVDKNKNSISSLKKLLDKEKPYSILIGLIRKKVKESEPHFDIDEETITIEFFDDEIQFQLREHSYAGQRDSTWGTITADEFLTFNPS